MKWTYMILTDYTDCRKAWGNANFAASTRGSFFTQFAAVLTWAEGWLNRFASRSDAADAPGEPRR